MDRVATRMCLEWKAALPEDIDHAMVGRGHFCDEGADAMLCGGAGEVRQHDRRDPMPLPRVGDQERHLRPLLVNSDVGRVRDDSRFRADFGDQRKAVGVIDINLAGIGVPT